MPVPRWLLLAHQLPTRPSNARVKTWRRLQQIGAVPTRNSVYVLPNNEQSREDFEWLRAEIVAMGGEATVFKADTLDQVGADDIMTTFQRTRQADYDRLQREAGRLTASVKRRRPSTASARDRLGRAVRQLRDRLSAVEQVDFFGAPGRQETAMSIGALDRLVAEEPKKSVASPRASSAAGAALSAAGYQRRRWVTRPRPGVDRMASAWLIQRYIDPRARFAFVETPGERDVAFDMFVGEFGHNGSHCTFEVLAQRFGVTDQGVTRVGQIVHDLDLKEARYALPETATVGCMIDGLRRAHTSDDALLKHGIALFETLASSFTVTHRESPSPSSRSQRAPARKRHAQSRS